MEKASTFAVRAVLGGGRHVGAVSSASHPHGLLTTAASWLGPERRRVQHAEHEQDDDSRQR